MRRCALWLLVMVGLACASLFFARDRLLTLVVDRALVRAPEFAARREVEVVQLSYEHAVVDRLLGATVSGGKARLRKQIGDRVFQLYAEAGKLTGTAVELFPPRVTLVLHDVVLQLDDSQLSSRYFFDGISLSTLVYREGVSPLHPSVAAKTLINQLDDLVTGDGTKAQIEMEGTAQVSIIGRTSELRVHTVRESGWTRLRLDLDDVRRVVTALEAEASEEEVQIMSEFPTRMPKILEFAQSGRRRGRQLAKTQTVATEDSFRHAFWSYSLALEFGPEFAQRVTDAHETLPGNSPAERSMDYHNNALARLWVKEGLSPAQLEQQILTDPRMIHRPSEVASRTGLLK